MILCLLVSSLTSLIRVRINWSLATFGIKLNQKNNASQVLTTVITLIVTLERRIHARILANLTARLLRHQHLRHQFNTRTLSKVSMKINVFASARHLADSLAPIHLHYSTVITMKVQLLMISQSSFLTWMATMKSMVP